MSPLRTFYCADPAEQNQSSESEVTQLLMEGDGHIYLCEDTGYESTNFKVVKARDDIAMLLLRLNWKSIILQGLCHGQHFCDRTSCVLPEHLSRTSGFSVGRRRNCEEGSEV